MARRSVREEHLAAMDDARVATALRHGLAELLEDVYEKKRKDMVSAFRKGEATYPILLGYAAQLAMAEEMVESLDRRVRRGKKALDQEVASDGQED